MIVFKKFALLTNIFSAPHTLDVAHNTQSAMISTMTAAFLDESATNDAADDDAADDHPAAGSDDLVTGDGARVDSADSDDDASDKEDNALATRVQPTPGAR